MANQETSLNEAKMAGRITSRGHLGVWILAATAVIVVLAIAAIVSVSGDRSPALSTGRQTDMEQQLIDPAVAAASLNRADTVRVTGGHGSPAAELYSTEPGWVQALEFERVMARKAASEAARMRYEMEHGR